MKIGIFDSGLGGLIIGESIITALPQYDYMYLGDTKRLPYGNRSQATVYEFTKEAVEWLFKQDCQLIILACNTASAEALRTLQREYLPYQYPNRRILGVLIPTTETAVEYGRRIGVLATSGTVTSESYIQEIKKLKPGADVFQVAAPLLVPLIEYNGLEYAEPIIESYLKPLREKNIDTLILGCTHYAAIKEIVRRLYPEVMVVSQDELIALKVTSYLSRHPEIVSELSTNSTRQYAATDLTPLYLSLAEQLTQKSLSFMEVAL